MGEKAKMKAAPSRSVSRKGLHGFYLVMSVFVLFSALDRGSHRFVQAGVGLLVGQGEVEYHDSTFSEGKAKQAVDTPSDSTMNCQQCRPITSVAYSIMSLFSIRAWKPPSSILEICSLTTAFLPCCS